MKNYKFSVSTSFFKRGNYVKQLYQQLLEQTHTNWEWIVTDDFSPELNAESELREICANDPRVKYIDQEFKQQLFYNPQIGCSGDIILQTDSDDIIAPTLLKHYNYWFNKRPEMYGMSCSYASKENIDYPSLVGKWVTESNYNLKNQTKLESMTMGRAWRNVIPHFESEGFKWYQNDTNILRHVENVGKWFWLPRMLYWYNHTPDSFSKFKGYTQEQLDDIERERQIIENRFPKLNTQEECSFIIDYLNVTDKLATFYESDDIAFSKHSQTVNFIDSSIQTWEKQQIKEIYWDWTIKFNDLSGEHNDEIIVYLTPENEIETMALIDKLRPLYSGRMIRIFFKSKDFLQEYWDSRFGFYVWNLTEDEGYVKIWL